MSFFTGIRPYQCEECGKKFTQSGHLVNHLRIHDGDKPYSCEVCDKAFTQSGHLSSHMKTHYNYMNEQYRAHACEICCKQFNRVSSTLLSTDCDFSVNSRLSGLEN